jgi:uroporphyrinogen decarboxylase
MRQAGRSLPAYRKLRERYSFLDVAADADLIAEVTLMPLDELGVDAAIVFADMMTPVASMGITYDIVEGVGPVLDEPIRTLEQVRNLPQIPLTESVPQLYQALATLSNEVDGRAAIIGFSGAPFTLASYLVEGRANQEFPETRRLMESDPETWHALMDRLTTTIIEYLREQVKAGAQAFQIFDSWVGQLSPEQYRRFALPYSARIFASTADLGVPRIHFGTRTAELLELMAEPKPEVVGVDWRIGLDEAWERIGSDLAIQGNLDPRAVLGDPAALVARAEEVLRLAGGRPGHIFNLGHGVLPDSNLDNLKLLVDTVHGYTNRGQADRGSANRGSANRGSANRGSGDHA